MFAGTEVLQIFIDPKIFAVMWQHILNSHHLFQDWEFDTALTPCLKVADVVVVGADTNRFKADLNNVQIVEGASEGFAAIRADGKIIVWDRVGQVDVKVKV